MKIEMRDDRTNIQANEQMKIVKSAFEFIHEDRTGREPPKEDVTVARAD